MIFVDTAAFLALENRQDDHHAQAMRFRDACLKNREMLITSDYILDESYTIIRFRAAHSIAVGFGETLRMSSAVRIEYLSPDILDEAWHIFRTYFDHGFSFTDCTSFRLMERLRVQTVFTFDKNFREYGRFIVKP